MPFILVILGFLVSFWPLLLVMFGRPAAWHGEMFTWMLIFHVKRVTNCSLYVRRLGMGL